MNGKIILALALLGIGAFIFIRRANAARMPLLLSFEPNSFFDSSGNDFNFEFPSFDSAGAIGPLNPLNPLPDTTGMEIDSDSIRAANEPGIFSTIGQALQPQTYMNPIDDPNVRAFLDMIAYSEGADYNTLFGGGTFDSFYDHPRKVISKSGYKSSAAGRYQIIRKTWDDVAPKIGAQDFLPATQDAAAIFLIKRRGALDDVIAGRFAAAVNKVRKEWASLPGAGYGQPERPFEALQAVYIQAGGTIAA